MVLGADFRSHPPILVAGALVKGFGGSDAEARRLASLAASASYHKDPLDGSATYESSVSIMQAGLVLKCDDGLMQPDWGVDDRWRRVSDG